MYAAASDAGVVGRPVLDAAGERIGQVSTLYVDVATGTVSFAGVTMIRRGRRRIVLVPLAGATLRDASITVSCGRQLARRAPSVRPGEALSADAEAGLFAHFDMPYRSGLPTAGRRLKPYR
jgi:hypothetical protein